MIVRCLLYVIATGAGNELGNIGDSHKWFCAVGPASCEKFVYQVLLYQLYYPSEQIQFSKIA